MYKLACKFLFKINMFWTERDQACLCSIITLDMESPHIKTRLQIIQEFITNEIEEAESEMKVPTVLDSKLQKTELLQPTKLV